jgi:hypothetical protein
MEIIKGNLYKSITTSLVVMANESTVNSKFSATVIISDSVHEKGESLNNWWPIAFQPYSAEIIIKEVIDFSKVQFVEMASGEILLTNGKNTTTSFCATRVDDCYYLEYWKKDSVKKVLTPNFK